MSKNLKSKLLIVSLILNIICLSGLGFIAYKVYSNQNWNRNLWQLQYTIDTGNAVPDSGITQQPGS